MTLHIGPGTFAPLRSHEVEAHSMEGEFYTIPESTCRRWRTRAGSVAVIAVGTSSVRALESYAVTGDLEGLTGLFIYPGFRFKLVEGDDHQLSHAAHHGAGDGDGVWRP